MNRFILLSFLLLPCLCLASCNIIGFGGAMAQAHEDQMLIEKPAEYDLSGQTVAVVIEADLVMHYEHPGMANIIAEAVAARIATNVENVKVLSPTDVAHWQYTTSQWTAMSSSEIANALKVDRVVYIQIQNYRLTPPGNQWLWEGRIDALIGVIEKNSYEQDGFDQTYEINSIFPRRPSVLTHEEATKADIERGLLSEFIKETSWLFYLHEEPKNPDRYRPELDQ